MSRKAFASVAAIGPRPAKRADILSPPNMARCGYNSHNGGRMVSVNIAELKNRLSKYLTFVKGGEEIVIRDRNLPVAKLVPFPAEEATEEDLLLVAAGKMRLPKSNLKIADLLKIRTGKVAGSEGIQALLDERDESR